MNFDVPSTTEPQETVEPKQEKSHEELWKEFGVALSEKEDAEHAANDRFWRLMQKFSSLNVNEETGPINKEQFLSEVLNEVTSMVEKIDEKRQKAYVAHEALREERKRAEQ